MRPLRRRAARLGRLPHILVEQAVHFAPAVVVVPLAPPATDATRPRVVRSVRWAGAAGGAVPIVWPAAVVAIRSGQTGTVRGGGGAKLCGRPLSL